MHSRPKSCYKVHEWILYYIHLFLIVKKFLNMNEQQCHSVPHIWTDILKQTEKKRTIYLILIIKIPKFSTAPKFSCLAIEIRSQKQPPPLAIKPQIQKFCQTKEVV